MNRLTGVEQYASSKGWVGQEELVSEGYRSFFGGTERAGNGGDRNAAWPAPDGAGQ